MIYTYAEYPTKKALRAAVKQAAESDGARGPVTYEPTPFGTRRGSDINGDHSLCGPGPYNRKWYARVSVADGVITRVIS